MRENICQQGGKVMNSKIGKEAWDFFKINFKWLIGAMLFLFIWSKGCFNPLRPQPPTVTHDTTVIVHKYESAPYIPPTINVLPAKPAVANQPKYKADTSSIQALRKQFDNLVKEHTQQRTYNDTLRIDTLGFVNVKDTISENRITSRKFSYNIKERLITTTIREHYKPKNQLYMGAGFTVPLSGTTYQQIDLGFLFKNKKDVMLGLSGNYNIQDNQFGVRASLYSKIRL